MDVVLQKGEMQLQICDTPPKTIADKRWQESAGQKEETIVSMKDNSHHHSWQVLPKRQY